MKLSKNFLIFVFISIFIALLTAPAAANNLLLNGDASNGLKGWTDKDGVWKTQTKYDQVEAYNSYFFFPKGFKGASGASTRIYQDVSVKNYVGMTATLSAYNRAWDTANTDESVLMAEFFDSNGKLLDTASVKSSKNPKWHKISVEKIIPSNAVTARISLVGIYYYGSEVDSYFDDVSFSISGSTPKAKNLGNLMIIYLDEGDKINIGALINGSVNNSVTYSSSNSNVAKVSSKGKITALSAGTATITAKSNDASLFIQIIVED